MRLAVFSDIHGNAPALEAVLADIDSRGADLMVCAGDLVGYGPFPNQVVEMLRKLRIPAVMGNYDQGAGYDLPECGCAYKDPASAALGRESLKWTQNEVNRNNKLYLQGLSEKIVLRVYGKTICIVHGSPRKINEYLYIDRPESSINRLLAEEGADLLICGHTHLPYFRRLDAKAVVNAGSVGKPKDGDPRAGYALIEVKPDGFAAETVRVAYDVEKTAQAIEDSELPDEFAWMLREAKG